MRQVRCRHLAAALFVTLLAETVRGEWIVRSFMDTIQPFATSTAPCMYFIQEGLAARVWNGNLNGTVKCDKTGTNNIQAYIHETGSNNDVGGYINPDPLSAANGTIPPKTQIDEAVYCGGLSGLQVGSYAVKVVGAEAPIFWTSNTTVNADIVVELVDTFWGFTDAVTVYTNKAEWEAITGGIAPPVMEELTRRLHEAADRHAAETLEARLARLERWIDEQSARQEAPLNASERERLVKLHMAPRTRPPPAHAAVFGTKLGAQRYLELWWDHPDGTKDMNEFVPFGFWKQTLYKMYLQDPSADACCNAPCWQSIGLGQVPPPPAPPAPPPSPNCGGNCPSNECPECLCGTLTNYVNVGQYCSQFDWDQTCCNCIVQHESGGNANAEYYDGGGLGYDVGLFAINSCNWASCNGGNPPCDPQASFNCARAIYQEAGGWHPWTTCHECGCC